MIKVELLTARLINGVHCAEHEIVEIVDDLARYLCGTGVAKVAPKASSASPATAAASAAKRTVAK